MPTNPIRYLNTHLVLESAADLTDLANAFRAAGLHPLHVTKGDHGNWYASFETIVQFGDPESNIAVMLSAIESLASPLSTIWRETTLREFNIGFDCGPEPWAFNQGLSNALLIRIGSVGASIRVTIYPAVSHDELAHD